MASKVLLVNAPIYMGNSLNMRLLLIITDYGSFNNFLSELAVKLANEGHEVNVICSNAKVIDLNDRSNYLEIGIKFHFVQMPRGFNILKQLKASIEISRLVDEIKPDLIHAHFTTGIFTTLLYKKLHFRVLGTIHGLGFPVTTGVRQMILKFVEKFCIRRLDQVWLLNKSDFQLLKDKFENKCFLLDTYGLGCDLNRFNSSNFVDEVASIKDQLNILDSDFVIAFTGRFVKFKGFDMVVRSFLKLTSTNPGSFKLLLIGGKDPIHPTGLSVIEEQSYAVCEDIIHVGFSNEVEKYLAVSDVFLFPSLKEGMPVCIIEALAMGVPVITADSRGCNDLIKNEVNGLLLSNSPSVQEIIDTITYLKESAELQKKFKAYSLSHRFELGRENYINKQIAVYKQLVNT